MHFIVGGRWFLDQPFLILNLGQHDVIIGQQWFKQQDMWLDVWNWQLVWPHERILKEELEAMQLKLLPKQILWQLCPQPEHQKDVEQWDQKMNEEDQRTAWYQPLRNEDMDWCSNMWKMEQALSGQNNSGTTPDQSHQHLIQSAWCMTIDIAIIGSAPFKQHMK